MSKEELLRYIQHTNPEMTMSRMIEELSKCRYSSVALVMVCENDKKLLHKEESMAY